MNNEKFKFCKLALSLIHVDGRVTPEERDWFEAKINDYSKNSVLNFSDEQIKELKKALFNPAKNYLSEFNSLATPAERVQILTILRVVAHLDDEYCNIEKNLYEELEASALKNVDLLQVEKNAAALSKKWEKEEEIKEKESPSSLWNLIQLIFED